jgi:hypothetical protein
MLLTIPTTKAERTFTIEQHFVNTTKHQWRAHLLVSSTVLSWLIHSMCTSEFAMMFMMIVERNDIDAPFCECMQSLPSTFIHTLAHNTKSKYVNSVALVSSVRNIEIDSERFATNHF